MNMDLTARWQMLQSVEAQLEAERERVRVLRALCDEMGSALEFIEMATSELTDDEFEELMNTADGRGSAALASYRALQATAQEDK